MIESNEVMKNFVKIIKEIKVESGNLAIFWIGQAGFVFKTSLEKIVYVDPYLTDYAHRVLPEYGFGFKRIMVSVIEPEEVDADYIISTHSHPDHFDADAMPIIAKNPRIHFIGASDCRELYVKAGIKNSRFTILQKFETLELEGFNLTSTYADHGSLAPEAIGLWFDFDGIKIWNVGDSAYVPEKWQDLFKYNIDILITPINGTYGNINEIEAVKLACSSHARVIIPCHFWMFPLHFGNPAKFLEAFKQYAPEGTPLLMEQGELFIYHKK